MTVSLNKYIGDRKFYRMVLGVAVPVMIQNGITNFVGLLDNIMVGALGTEQMSGVSIVNQFIFIFNILVFGAVSAAGIFTAQYFGSKDNNGIRYTFRFKILICTFATLIGAALFYFLDDFFIGLFLNDASQTGNVAKTLGFGKEYLIIMLVGLLPYSISQVYASTMRETGDTFTPMIVSVSAVLTNFILNGVLIFGLLFFPAMGVKGAAIATVVSRFVELIILVWYSHRNTVKFPYLKGAYRSMYIPAVLTRRIAFKGLPLMLNELLWAIAIMLRNQCYSTRGLEVVAAQNIQSTLINVFNVVYLSLGSSIAIVVGRHLGADEPEKARDTARKMITFSVMCAIGMAALFSISSFVFPLAYNTEPSIRSLATFLMLISSLNMPFNAYANAAYFTMRSGGRVGVTFIFDCVYMWAIIIPVSAAVAYLTPVSIYILYPICQSVETLKAFFGAFLLRKFNWVKRLVSDPEE